MPAFEPVLARRVVATSAALDALTLRIAAAHPADTCLRLAPDELLVIAGSGAGSGAAPADGALTGDPHAIDVADAGWSGAWVDSDLVLELLSWATTWPVGSDRPALLQGMAAGVPVKVWLPTTGTALVLVATPLAHDLQERWR